MVPGVLLRCPIKSSGLRFSSILSTAATRSGRFICHWQRSPRSPDSICIFALWGQKLRCCRRRGRRQASVPRTLAFKWVRVRFKQRINAIVNVSFTMAFIGAGDRTRTGTLSPAADFEVCNSFGNPRNLAEFLSI